MSKITDGWEIVERGAINGMHLLKIYRSGNVVETKQSGSHRYLEEYANGKRGGVVAGVRDGK